MRNYIRATNTGKWIRCWCCRKRFSNWRNVAVLRLHYGENKSRVVMHVKCLNWWATHVTKREQRVSSGFERFTVYDLPGGPITIGADGVVYV